MLGCYIISWYPLCSIIIRFIGCPQISSGWCLLALTIELASVLLDCIILPFSTCLRLFAFKTTCLVEHLQEKCHNPVIKKQTEDFTLLWNIIFPFYFYLFLHNYCNVPISRLPWEYIKIRTCKSERRISVEKHVLYLRHSLRKNTVLRYGEFFYEAVKKMSHCIILCFAGQCIKTWLRYFSMKQSKRQCVV
jgi:hypothetical protein